MAILKDTAMVHTSSTFHISLCILQYILLYILFLPFYIYLIVIKQQQQRIMKAQMLPQMTMRSVQVIVQIIGFGDRNILPPEGSTPVDSSLEHSPHEKNAWRIFALREVCR